MVLEVLMVRRPDSQSDVNTLFYIKILKLSKNYILKCILIDISCDKYKKIKETISCASLLPTQ